MTDRLYDLVPAYQGIMDALEAAEPEEMTALLDTMDAVNAAIEVKAEGYSKMITMLEKQADIQMAEADRLARRAQMNANKAKSLKTRLQYAMETIGRDEIRTDLFVLRVRNNPPAVDVHDPASLPSEYQRKTVKIDPDRLKIKAALMDGKEVPGAALMQSRRLDIK